MSAHEVVILVLVADRLLRSATGMRVVWDRRRDLIRLGPAEFAVKDQSCGAGDE